MTLTCATDYFAFFRIHLEPVEYDSNAQPECFYTSRYVIEICKNENGMYFSKILVKTAAIAPSALHSPKSITVNSHMSDPPKNTVIHTHALVSEFDDNQQQDEGP